MSSSADQLTGKIMAAKGGRSKDLAAGEKIKYMRGRLRLSRLTWLARAHGYRIRPPCCVRPQRDLWEFPMSVDKGNTDNWIDKVSFSTLYLIKFNHQVRIHFPPQCVWPPLNWLAANYSFIIAFILIITTLVQRIALCKAQKGAIVRELEQFLASNPNPKKEDTDAVSFVLMKSGGRTVGFNKLESSTRANVLYRKRVARVKWLSQR